MSNISNTNVSLMEASKFKINTQYFSPHDLALFVDSIETIARLTREKEARKDHLKLITPNNLSKKGATLPGINSLSILDSSASSEDDADEELMLLENRKVPKTPNSEGSEYDETYFSAPSSAQSSPRHSVICKTQLYKNIYNSIKSVVTASDSEESGVFPISESQQNIYELQIGARITKFKSSNAKSRLLSMVRKKESGKAPSVLLISRRDLDEYETLEMYQQEQKQKLPPESVLQENDKLSRFSTLHFKKKSKLRLNCPDGSADEHFLDKALRYLTL